MSYGTGPLRVSGNLSYVLADELDLDRAGAALGLISAAGRWAACWVRPLRRGRGRLLRRRGGPVANDCGQARPGTRVTIQRAGLGIALIAHDGLSTQRQFSGQESRYLGAELRMDLYDPSPGLWVWRPSAGSATLSGLICRSHRVPRPHNCFSGAGMA